MRDTIPVCDDDICTAGRNFGPSTILASERPRISYGPASWWQPDADMPLQPASSCTIVTTPLLPGTEEISCAMAPGAGKNHSMVVQVAGVYSAGPSNFTVSYDVPVLVSC